MVVAVLATMVHLEQLILLLAEQHKLLMRAQIVVVAALQQRPAQPEL